MRPIDVVDFQGIGQTAWERMSVSEVRHFARGLSGSGVAADARAIGSAGDSHADSLAELQRDAGLLSARWKGEAKDQSYAEIGQYTDRAYTNAVALRRLVGDVEDLSDTATTTNEQFSDLPDPPSGAGASWDSGYRNQVAESVRSTYSAPVQTSASTLPLGESNGRTDFRHVGPAATKNANTAGGAPTEPGTGSPTDGTGTGSGTSDAGTGTGDTGTDSVDSATTDTGTTDGTTDAATSDTGSGAGTGTGAGTGSGGQGAGDGLGTGATADPAQDEGVYDPVDDTGTPASLLSPSTAVPVTSTARTGAGLSGLGGRGGPAGTASPLGLRQDTAVARSTAAPVATGTTSTGARPSTGPYGMPAAGAGAPRGQGDGRHRVPAYLIDRSNGEEIVGGMPLVGPGVIGQWKSDGAHESPRADTPRPDAPARTRVEPRPR